MSWMDRVPAPTVLRHTGAPVPRRGRLARHPPAWHRRGSRRCPLTARAHQRCVPTRGGHGVATGTRWCRAPCPWCPWCPVASHRCPLPHGMSPAAHCGAPRHRPPQPVGYGGTYRAVLGQVGTYGDIWAPVGRGRVGSNRGGVDPTGMRGHTGEDGDRRSAPPPRWPGARCDSWPLFTLAHTQEAPERATPPPIPAPVPPSLHPPTSTPTSAPHRSPMELIWGVGSREDPRYPHVPSTAPSTLPQLTATDPTAHGGPQSRPPSQVLAPGGPTPTRPPGGRRAAGVSAVPSALPVPPRSAPRMGQLGSLPMPGQGLGPCPPPPARCPPAPWTRPASPA